MVGWQAKCQSVFVLYSVISQAPGLQPPMRLVHRWGGLQVGRPGAEAFGQTWVRHKQLLDIGPQLRLVILDRPQVIAPAFPISRDKSRWAKSASPVMILPFKSSV